MHALVYAALCTVAAAQKLNPARLCVQPTLAFDLFHKLSVNRLCRPGR